MSPASALLLSLLAGASAATAYLAALWFTVSRLPGRTRPGAWLLASALTRMALLVLLFGWIAGHSGASGLLAATTGFVVVRWLACRWMSAAGRPAKVGR